MLDFSTQPPHPQPESDRESVKISFVPSWVEGISKIALNGWNMGSLFSGISCDENGDLVLYRELTEDDYRSYPTLRSVKEIWCTYEFPDKNEPS